MSIYTVKWGIDIEADTPKEAAEEALKIMQDTNSTATYFEIEDENNKSTIIGLYMENLDEDN